MKKILYALIFMMVLGSASILSAQDDGGDLSRFRFGAQLSPVAAWMTSDKSQIKGGGLVVGMKLGALGEYNFAKNYSLTFGIGFGFNQGGKLQFPQGGNLLPKSELAEIPEDFRRNLPSDTKITYKLTYIEFPFSLKMRTREYGYVRYFVEAPIITLGGLTAAKANIDAANIDVNKQKIKDDMKRLNAQWGLGAGMEYNFSQDNALGIGLYYNQGFFDLTKNYGDLSDKTVDHNVTLRLAVFF